MSKDAVPVAVVFVAGAAVEGVETDGDGAGRSVRWLSACRADPIVDRESPFLTAGAFRYIGGPKQSVFSDAPFSVSREDGRTVLSLFLSL